MRAEENGIITTENLQIPSKKRLEKGPVAIIECPESIPCNPCVDACPFHAISMNDINALPEIDFDKCTGCGSCIGKCPGLAIFVVDMTYSDNEAVVRIPYEFSLPAIGETVKALNREGKEIGNAKIVKIIENKNKTSAISLSVDKSIAMEVRNIHG
jgi:Fe-S-cluster-containing hydrogenase component 2